MILQYSSLQGRISGMVEPRQQVLEHSDHIGADFCAVLDLHLRMHARKIDRLPDQSPYIATTAE